MESTRAGLASGSDYFTVFSRVQLTGPGKEFGEIEVMAAVAGEIEADEVRLPR